MSIVASTFGQSGRRALFLFLATAAALLVAGGFYLWGSDPQSERPDAGPSGQHRAPTAIGFVDDVLEDTPEPGQITVHGWALGKAGIASVELVVNGRQRFPLATAIPRIDVARIHPGYPDSDRAGFRGGVDVSQMVGSDRIRILEIVVTDKQGAVTLLKQVTPKSANAIGFSKELPRHKPSRNDPFYFIMATSNVAGGGAADIDTVFRPFESQTMKVGVRVPILYMRTTLGKAADYAFDPDFPTSRKCGERQIAGDNLNEVIAWSIARRVPVLFTLNGGIWADAACDSPQWDINDFLEQDRTNCQWNQHNQVMADDYLKNLTGSYSSPELGRSLTFNVYADSNRHYKRRNLQQAARLINEFAVRHPELFIGVTLDPDVYLNPFFEGSQWYDYNPGTLRQFREWLQGSGPYAGPTKGAVPDLSAHRRKQPLGLNDVNALSGRLFKRWEEVDPPRSFDVVTGKKPFWEDAWVTEWEHFRRHLVSLHYDELSKWVAESGIGVDFIYSAQGFMAPGKYIQPFPLAIESAAKNYDAGGMSVEGSIPSHGHLGAILYGASAFNSIRMETRDSLFSVFRKLDPGWAVVEFNTADLTDPERLPDFAKGYRSLREIYNYGARFISPMAWNGSRGSSAGQPGFAAHTALRETPLESAIKQFMITHANLPSGSRLWTFGAGNHADDDGWRPSRGTQGFTGPGLFTLRANADSSGMNVKGLLGPGPVSLSCWSQCLGSLESPGDLAFRPADYPAIVVKVSAVQNLESLGVDGQGPDGGWVQIIPPTPVARLRSTDAGLHLRHAGLPSEMEFDRIRLNWKTTATASIGLQRIAFLSR